MQHRAPYCNVTRQNSQSNKNLERTHEQRTRETREVHHRHKRLVPALLTNLRCCTKAFSRINITPARLADVPKVTNLLEHACLTAPRSLDSERGAVGEVLSDQTMRLISQPSAVASPCAHLQAGLQLEVVLPHAEHRVAHKEKPTRFQHGATY